MSEALLKALSGAGWTQGSVLPADMHLMASQRLKAELDIDSLPTDRFVIVSHPCDVASRDFDKEPWVECLRFQSISAVDGVKNYGRTPRELQTQLQSGLCIKLIAYERFRVDRRQLADYKPTLDLSLTGSERRLIAGWLARRYDRYAFPDHFNDRIDRDKLEKFLKKYKAELSSVLVNLPDHQQDADLQEHEKYSPAFVLLAPGDRRPKNESEILKAFKSLFPADQWDLQEDAAGNEPIRLRSHEEISLLEYDNFKMLEYEYLSNRYPESPAAPPRLDS